MFAQDATAPVSTPQLGLGPGVSIGGIMPIMSATEMFAQQRRISEAAQNLPFVTSLASHIRKCWSIARDAKEQTVEPRMFKSLRQRRGDYDPDKLSKIRIQGGSEIYMMLTSAKCRGASSWLRDVLMAQGSEKPWTIKPTPIPSLPPEMINELRQRAVQELAAYMQASGQTLNQVELRKFLMELREQFISDLYETARAKCAQMEKKMEDQLVEGGFPQALSQFIDDLVTFPSAFLKGPVVRRKPRLKWVPGPTGQSQLQVADELVQEWERVDPFMIYPSPSASSVDEGYLIERHKLSQGDLEQLIGVEGYDDGAIRAVIDSYGKGGLQEWLQVDTTKAVAEGKSTSHTMNNPDSLIDAVQFWGAVPGKLLQDWGVEAEIDPAKTFHCEAWLIGQWVIKAVLNPDPLGRRPYYKASYEEIPGAFWGNTIPDLLRDCQDMCNSAARAIANNMSIASGPQVAFNVDRLPAGEDITQMHPWKIWQFTSDPMGSSADAVQFFQPGSNVNELQSVYDKFALLADEYTNIPRYMTGDAPAGGAGRTASGMNMLMSNANKGMKQVVTNIDTHVLTPALERQYFYNMKYSDDPVLKGDAQVVARGAASIMAKEAAQIRRNEFLAATANPFDMQIMGPEGRQNLLRERAKDLDMDPDDIVPSKVKQTLIQKFLAAQQQMAQAASPADPTQNGQTLENGAPVTGDHFSPTPS